MYALVVLHREGVGDSKETEKQVIIKKCLWGLTHIGLTPDMSPTKNIKVGCRFHIKSNVKCYKTILLIK